MPNNQNLLTEQYNFCTSQLETTTEKFVWTIENFSEHPDIKRGKYLKSTEFNSAAPNYKLLKWRMTFSVSDNCISLYIYPINYEDDKMKAKYQFSIRKPDGREFKFKIIDLNYCGYGSWCWSETKMKMEDLFNEENGYLNGGRLRIECTLTFQQKSIKFELPDEVPECRVIQEDLGHLFEKSLFWDCKIISADDKKFKVHKCILGCRSPVFGAMFQHKMTENNDNIIDIVDIKGDVIEQMLHFIYSGKEPDFGEMVEDLLFAADKYEINGLKLLCENKLIYSLGSENACELFSLANLYSAEQLKAHAIGFIKMHLNEVMESKGWKTLADEQLKNQILEAIAK